MLPRRQRVRRRWWRRGFSAAAVRLIVPLGIACALAGILLTALVEPPAMYMSAAQVHVGRSTLHRLQQSGDREVFVGDAAYVLDEKGDGTADAASSWRDSGTTSWATCSMRRDPGRLLETCSFHLRDGDVTSIDTLDLAAGAVWQRTYSDGRRLTVTAPADGGAVPLAFPFGR